MRRVAANRGLLLGSSSESLELSPPRTITEHELELAVAMLGEAIGDIGA